MDRGVHRERKGPVSSDGVEVHEPFSDFHDKGEESGSIKDHRATGERK